MNAKLLSSLLLFGVYNALTPRTMAAPDGVIVEQTAQLVNDSVQAMFTQSSSTDTQYWVGGEWKFTNDQLAWQSQGGPSAAAAELYLWRQKFGYTVTPADQAINSWLRGRAIQSMTWTLTNNLKADGSYANDPQMIVPDLCSCYIGLGNTLDTTTHTKWLTSMMQMVAYLIKAGDLSDSSAPGWKATDGWYTNGNYELLESLILYQVWIATGDHRYKDLFETQWAHTLSPSPVQWPNFGLRSSSSWVAPSDGLTYSETGVVPSLPDGSDGREWLVECGGSNSYGYDGDYTHLQTLFASRLYLASQDPRVLKLLNLLTNQVLAHTNTSTWVLDATHGSRHSLSFGLFTESIDVLAWEGGRSTFVPYVAPQFSSQVWGNFLGNAYQNWGSPGTYRAYGTDLSVILQADLVSDLVTGLSAPAATIGNSQVTLSWNVPIGALSYNIKRGLAAAGPFTTIATGIQPSTYTDTAATNGTHYYYVVSAANLAGESANSPSVAATPQAVVPAAPTALAAVTAGNANVALTWLLSPSATSYNVKRATTSGGPYTNIATGVTATSISPYMNTGLVDGTTYYYVVTGVNSIGEGAPSPEAACTPQILATPSYPVAIGGNAQATVYWGGATGATSYNIKRAVVNHGPYTTVGSVSSSATSYTDTGLTNGTTYYYVVSAVNTTGEGPNSIQATAAASILPPPAGLLGAPGNGTVTLTWAPSSGASSYHVKRSYASNPYVTIASPTSTSFTDSGLTNGTQYHYFVTAVSGSSESTNSSRADVTPQVSTAPGAPTSLVATAGSNRNSLSWGAASGAATYSIQRSTIHTGPYTIITSGITGLGYTDATAVQGLKYYYVVNGVNTGGMGPNSNEANATPTP